MLTIRRATAADARLVFELARRTFVETFGPANTAEDMAAYVSSAFSEARQAAEIADPRMTTLIADEGGAAVGYAQLAQKGAPACVTGPAPIELVRFYVDAPWQGRGVAQALMREVDAAARACARTIWLGVWEHNPRAIAFYRKCGFVDVGCHAFMLGSDRQTDRIMMRTLR